MDFFLVFKELYNKIMRQRRIRVISQTSQYDDQNLIPKVEEEEDLLTSNLHILKMLQQKTRDELMSEHFVNKFKHTLYLVFVLLLSHWFDKVNYFSFSKDFLHYLFTALFVSVKKLHEQSITYTKIV